MNAAGGAAPPKGKTMALIEGLLAILCLTRWPGLEKRFLQNTKDKQREGVARDGGWMAHPEAHDAGSEEHSREDQADGPKDDPHVGFGEL